MNRKAVLRLMVRVFIEDGQLRPIWRFFLSVALIVAAFVAAGGVVGKALHLEKGHPIELAAAFWQSLVSLIAILAVFKLMTAFFERRPLGSVGLALHPRWGRELGRGLVVGATMLLLAVALEWAFGFAHFTFTPHPVFWNGSFAFVLFAVAAANEEATFRGYPFQRLAESIAPAGAIAVTSAFFGFAHSLNPHRTWISTLNTALVGIPFCIAYLRTRSLWMPIGMHMIWNFLLGFVLGLPVSGFTIPASVLAASVHGPPWLTGGDYGPEGGLLATAAILLGSVYLSLARSIYTTEEMKTLVSAPGSSRWPEPLLTTLSGPSGDETKRD